MNHTGLSPFVWAASKISYKFSYNTESLIVIMSVLVYCSGRSSMYENDKLV